MKVCLIQEGEENPYKVIYASMSETPYRILRENKIFYETRDVFLNGQKITSANMLNPLNTFKVQEATVFISVRKRI